MDMMGKNIVIVGNGGFAREVEWLLSRVNSIYHEWKFLGFIDNEAERREERYVVGDDSYVLSAEEPLYVVLAIGSSDIRRKLHHIYQQNINIHFPNLVDPSVMMSHRVNMGEGNIICAGNVVTVDIEIGDCCIFNLNCTIGHDVRIGNYVTVNPGANISGNVTIEDNVNIGTGSQIIQGIKIADHVTLGAGGVVVTDLPARCTAVGVPARIIKFF